MQNALFRMPLADPGKLTQLGGEFVLAPGYTCEFAHRMTNTSSELFHTFPLFRASTSPFPFTCPSCPLLPSAPFRVLNTPPEVKYWPLLLLPESPPYPFFLSSILHPLDIIFLAFLFLYFHYRPLHERLANARLCRPHGSPRRRPYRRLRRPHHHRVRGTPARRVPAKRAGAARTRDERVAGRPGRRDRKVSPTSDYLTP